MPERPGLGPEKADLVLGPKSLRGAGGGMDVCTVLNPIDMRDRDLILIISFVMHFTGIEGHSFLWLEKFPVAFHS